MAAPKSIPDTGSYTFPTTSGPVTGTVGLALVALIFVVLALDGITLGVVRVEIALLLFGLLTWSLMLRPKIRVRDKMLHLVNPFQRISIPLHLIDRVTVRSVTKVVVGEETFIGIAVGRKTRNMVRPTSYGAPGGPFSLTFKRDGEAATRDKSADMLESWVTVAARDARHDAERFGVAVSEIQRVRLWWLIAACGVLAVAFLVSFLF